MFKKFLEPFLRAIVEKKIKRAFLNDKEARKTSLRSWISLANNNPTFPWWQYQFDNNESLVEFGLKSSDESLRKARIPIFNSKNFW